MFRVTIGEKGNGNGALVCVLYVHAGGDVGYDRADLELKFVTGL